LTGGMESVTMQWHERWSEAGIATSKKPAGRLLWLSSVCAMLAAAGCMCCDPDAAPFSTCHLSLKFSTLWMVEQNMVLQSCSWEGRMSTSTVNMHQD